MLQCKDKRFKDLTGRVFDRLTVLRQGENGRWVCHCSCGNVKEIRRRNLRPCYHTRSCGYLIFKHGLTHTSEYAAWENMINRCNIVVKYIVRDIQVCTHWRSSYLAFLQHVGPKPEPKKKYSLDRIDNDDHYRPGNVRWATTREQTNNRRSKGCVPAVKPLRNRLRENEPLPPWRKPSLILLGPSSYGPRS